MTFGLNNTPQIYQCLIDNAMYGYLKIGAGIIRSRLDRHSIDLFTIGDPDTDPRPYVLGRRSYINDILRPATSWNTL